MSAAQSGGVTRVRMEGTLDLSSLGGLDAELRRVEGLGDGPVQIDLRQIDFIDSTGLQLLVGAQRRCAEAGRTLTLLTDADGPARRILELACLDEQFEPLHAAADAPPDDTGLASPGPKGLESTP